MSSTDAENRVSNGKSTVFQKLVNSKNMTTPFWYGQKAFLEYKF